MNGRHDGLGLRSPFSSTNRETVLIPIQRLYGFLQNSINVSTNELNLPGKIIDKQTYLLNFLKSVVSDDTKGQIL